VKTPIPSFAEQIAAQTKGKRTRPTKAQELTDKFLGWWDHAGMLDLPRPIREHRFHPTRGWRFDLAWLDEKLAIEFQGGLYGGGVHNNGQRLHDAYDKHNEAILLGWRVLQFGTNHVKDRHILKAYAVVREALTNGRN
jgi:very-short-patch-repair endonuclease